MEGMNQDSVSYLQALAALILVLCLMIGLAAAFRYFSGQKAHNILSPLQRRLKVLEVKSIDHRHKMVLVQRDDTQHLVLISGTNAPIVIESHIDAPTDETAAANKNAATAPQKEITA